jgi:hypothetical protein
VTHNVLQLAEGGAFGEPLVKLRLMFYSEPKSFCHHVRPAFGKLLLAGVIISFNLKL